MDSIQQGPSSYAGSSTVPDWPPVQRAATSSSRDAGTLATVAALALAALLSLVYAFWAFTARRGIFADFSNRTTVTPGHARSSDRIDTTLLVVAGLCVVIASALWVMRRINARTGGGVLDLGGLVATGVGVILVLVGLFLSTRISDGIDQVAQGDKGVTATLVTGSGFLLVALGLLAGIAAVRARRDTEPTAYGQPGTGGGYRTW